MSNTDTNFFHCGSLEDVCLISHKANSSAACTVQVEHINNRWSSVPERPNSWILDSHFRGKESSSSGHRFNHCSPRKLRNMERKVQTKTKFNHEAEVVCDQYTDNFPSLKRETFSSLFLYNRLINSLFSKRWSFDTVSFWSQPFHSNVRTEKCHCGTFLPSLVKIQVLQVPAAAQLHSVLNCLPLIWINKLANPQTMQAFTSNLISLKFNKLTIKVEAQCRDAAKTTGCEMKARDDIELRWKVEKEGLKA